MAEKFNKSKLSSEELAKHLRQPDGEDGREVAKLMNKGNQHICLNSYKVLLPQPNSSILEIGMGNGFYVKDLVNLNDHLTYVGLDFSTTMVEEATQLNRRLMEEQMVSFIHGSIENLPFEDDSFDNVTTTNTVYFWPDLKANAAEIHRVLKPNGKVLIAYRSKDVLDNIEATNYGFSKYHKEDIEQVLHEVGFNRVTTEEILEPDLDYDGKPIEVVGVYTVGVK